MYEEWTGEIVVDRTEQRRRASVALAAPKLEGYEIVAYIGEGTYGDVWEASDKSKTKVAIKRFRRALCKQSCDEVEMLRELDDARGIVKIKDAHLKCEPYCYVMEYMPKGTLRQKMKSQGGKLPFKEAWSIFRELIEALAYVHAKGAVHCDVKPENVLLDSLERPRLSDFGQARSHQGRSLGTLFYMPPEQARSEPPDPQSDIYALGALLYEMLTGKPPRHNEELAAQLSTRSQSTQEMKERLVKYASCLDSAPDPVAHRDVREVDPDAAAIIEKCLAIDLDARPKNAAAVGELIAERQTKRRRRPLMIVCRVVVPVAIVLGMLAVLGSWWTANERLELTWMKEVVADNQSIANAIALATKERFDERIEAVRRESEQNKWIDALAKIGESDAARVLFDRKGYGGNQPLGAEEDAARPSMDAFFRLLEKLSVDQEFKRWSFTAADGASLAGYGYFKSSEKKEMDDTNLGGDFSWRGYFNADRDNLPKIAAAPIEVTAGEKVRTRRPSPSEETAQRAREILRERLNRKRREYLAAPYFRKSADEGKKRWNLTVSSVIERGDEPVGVISGQMNYEDFNEWIKDFERASIHRKVIVANEQGETMYHPRLEEEVKANDKKELEVRSIKLEEEVFFKEVFDERLVDPVTKTTDALPPEPKPHQDPWYSSEDKTEYLIGRAVTKLENGQKLAVFVMEDKTVSLSAFQDTRWFAFYACVSLVLMAVGAIGGSEYLYRALSREVSHDDA